MSPGLLLRSIAVFLVALLLLLFAGLTYLAMADRNNPYPAELASLAVPTFSQQVIDYVPSYDGSRTIPFAAGAIIDIDNDGVEEVFIGGGLEQQDAIFRFTEGIFVDITAETGLSKVTPDKTFSATSLDYDRDRDNDLLITRKSGVFLYLNNNGTFTGTKLDLELDPTTVPLSAAPADLNGDGAFDLYVSGYIAREHVEGETIFNQTYGGHSGLFLNRGDNSFDNITESAGLSYQHNTFQSVFIDVDKDDLLDLVVAHDTGQVRTWKNLGNMTFENVSNPSSDYFSYPMGIAVTDLGNDGFPDFFFSNVGSTVPMSLVRGDLRDDQVLHTDWILMRNDGNFTFTDVAEESQVARFEFSWGAVFEDFNLDGRDDLVVSENYEGWPLHKLPMWRLDGRFLLQDEAGRFHEAGEQSGVRNRHYGIAPLVADFNQDGYPDLVHVNLLGPQTVFLSEGGSNGHVKVILPNTVDSIGARVTVHLDDGAERVQTFVVGEGLVSDQTHVLSFGLGAQNAESVSMQSMSGDVVTQRGPFRNQTIRF